MCDTMAGRASMTFSTMALSFCPQCPILTEMEEPVGMVREVEWMARASSLPRFDLTRLTG